MNTRNPPALKKPILLVLFLIVITPSCAPRLPVVIVQAGNPLKFVVSGKGIVKFLSVRGVNSPNALHMYWQIVPLEETDLTSLEKLGPIVYGKVPAGFRQVVPEHGEPQPILESDQGVLFWVSLKVRNASDGGKSFVFRDGKILVQGEEPWR